MTLERIKKMMWRGALTPGACRILLDRVNDPGFNGGSRHSLSFIRSKAVAFLVRHMRNDAADENVERLLSPASASKLAAYGNILRFRESSRHSVQQHCAALGNETQNGGNPTASP
jgi:hypothetical protein